MGMFENIEKGLDKRLGHWDKISKSNGLKLVKFESWVPRGGDPQGNRVGITRMLAQDDIPPTRLYIKHDDSTYSIYIKDIKDFSSFLNVDDSFELQGRLEIQNPKEGIDMEEGQVRVTLDDITVLINKIFDK